MLSIWHYGLDHVWDIDNMSTFTFFPIKMRFARTHSKTWQPMIDIWARTAGNLYLNKNMKIIMLVHRFICFPLQTYCDYLSLSLCSFQIWFELVTPPVTQRGEGKQGQWEKRQVLIGLAVVCWGGFSRQGFPLRLGRKKQTKILRSQAHSLQKQVIFCLSFSYSQSLKIAV